MSDTKNVKKDQWHIYYKKKFTAGFESKLSIQNNSVKNSEFIYNLYTVYFELVQRPIFDFHFRPETGSKAALRKPLVAVIGTES